MSFKLTSHVEGVESVHTDQQDVVDIGRIGSRAKGHPGQQTEGNLLQYHNNILRNVCCCSRDYGSLMFRADDQ
jgi:hypothetical protein